MKLYVKIGTVFNLKKTRKCQHCPETFNIMFCF